MARFLLKWIDGWLEKFGFDFEISEFILEIAVRALENAVANLVVADAEGERFVWFWQFVEFLDDALV